MLFSRSESRTGVSESCEMVWTVRKRKLYDFFNIFIEKQNTRRRKLNENWRRSFEFWEASRGCWKCSVLLLLFWEGNPAFGEWYAHIEWEWISIEKMLLLSGTWEILRYFYFDPWSAHRITQEISEILSRVRALFGPMTCEFFLHNCLFGHSTANFIQVF